MITKVTVERVFNIGNYQSIRFGMEVSVNLEMSNARDIKSVYDRALTATEQSFNQIMSERRQVAEQFDKYCNEKAGDAKRDQRFYTEH